MGQCQPSLPVPKTGGHIYIEQLEQYFVANEIVMAERKRVILLSVCGARTYQLVRDLVSPAKPANKTFDQIVELVTKHYSPKPSTVMQRFQLNARYQGKDESIAAFVAALRQLSEFCEFGATLNQMLRDRIVVGVSSEKIQLRLLAEPDLTYDRTLQLAQAMETAERDRQQLKGGKDNSILYHQSKTGKSSTQRRVECYRCCGNHLASDCRFKETECRNCGKKGHLARACRSKKKEGMDNQPVQQQSQSRNQQGRNRTHYVGEQVENTDTHVEDKAYSMFTLHDTSTQSYITQVNVCGHELDMEINTGASWSILSEETCRAGVSRTYHWRTAIFS